MTMRRRKQQDLQLQAKCGCGIKVSHHGSRPASRSRASFLDSVSVEDLNAGKSNVVFVTPSLSAFPLILWGIIF